MHQTFSQGSRLFYYITYKYYIIFSLVLKTNKFQLCFETAHLLYTSTHVELAKMLYFNAGDKCVESGHVCVQQRDRCSSVSAGSVRLSGGEPETSHREALEEVQAISGNGQCCDCGEPGPDWASINLGITLCITCSGIHR